MGRGVDALDTFSIGEITLTPERAIEEQTSVEERPAPPRVHAQHHEPPANIVMTRTPLRVSFAGGGTDLPDFYDVEEGAVLSAAVDKYVYVTVKRHSELFNEPIRLNYSRTEQVNTIGEIENNIARECLRFLEI